MEHPDTLRYTADHEWVRPEGDEVVVGITDYAQDALGDVVFVDLPSVGTVLAARDVVCEVESTKAVSEIYAPVAGSIVAVNESLDEHPELLNQDPYGEGWIFRLQPDDPAEIGTLLDKTAYEALLDS